MFAEVCKNVTQKLAVALIALFNLKIKQIDIVRAFLNLTANIDIYVEVLPNQETNKEALKDVPKQVYKLLKALYSLKQAP